MINMFGWTADNDNHNNGGGGVWFAQGDAATPQPPSADDTIHFAAIYVLETSTCGGVADCVAQSVAGAYRAAHKWLLSSEYTTAALLAFCVLYVTMSIIYVENFQPDVERRHRAGARNLLDRALAWVCAPFVFARDAFALTARIIAAVFGAIR